jgi:(p)ppGpp synthase/HD superfamily hydrolase
VNSDIDIEHALEVASPFLRDGFWHHALTALLHDVLEDTDLTEEFLRTRWVPADIANAVVALTRREDETYDDYVLRAARHPIARNVKLEDLKANLARLDDAHESLRPRYERGLALLLDTERSPTQGEATLGSTD